MNILFDVDGTLVDTYPGIRRSVEEAIGVVFPGRSLPAGSAIRVGPRIREIMRGLFGELPEEEMARLEAAFRESYDNRGWADFKPYPGMLEVLRQFESRDDLALFIVTNKPAIPTSRVLEAAGLKNTFADVVCPDTRSPRFVDKRSCIEHLMAKHGLSPDDCVYFGDTKEDLAASTGAGIAFIGAGYGYGNLDGLGLCVTIGSIRELPTVIERGAVSLRHSSR